MAKQRSPFLVGYPFPRFFRIYDWAEWSTLNIFDRASPSLPHFRFFLEKITSLDA